MFEIPRILVAFALLIAVFAAFVCGTEPAAATIYSADIEGRIELSDEQLPEVQRILRQSERDLEEILQTNGIDPEDDQPSAMKLFNASAEMSALGQRTRAQLAEILDDSQLALYDQITAEVEQRIRNAFGTLDRPDMSQVK